MPSGHALDSLGPDPVVAATRGMDKVRRSVLVDAKADILLYGNAERAVVEVAHRIANGETAAEIDDVRGTAVMKKSVPEGWTELAADDIGNADEGARMLRNTQAFVRLPSFEQVEADPETYARASRVLHRESNPGNARTLVQRHGDRELWVTPPPIPLTTAEMYGIYELPYARGPHPSYGGQKIPAWEMIKFSVTIMRGCFGGAHAVRTPLRGRSRVRRLVCRGPTLLAELHPRRPRDRANPSRPRSRQ